jgi:aldehyde:ferredoxin oxidoreductase
MAMLTLALSVSTRGGGHVRCTPPMAWWGEEITLPERWKKIYRNAGAEEIINKPWVCHPVIADIVTYFETINTSADIIEICKNTMEYYYFYGFKGREVKDDLEWHAEWIEAVTGVNVDRHYMETVAKRVLTLEKAYNVREGKLREDDMPSHRFMEKRRGGPLDGKALDEKELQRLFDFYYEIHGWDPRTSVPKRKTLEELGLTYVADDLENKVPGPN